LWDRSTWTTVHREWLGPQTFAHQNTELTFIDNLAACDGLTARRQTLDERLSQIATDPEFWPLVRRLRAFRGIDTLSALIIVLEVADFTRFPRAVQLGSWLGLVPSREQSGESDRHGSVIAESTPTAAVERMDDDARRPWGLTPIPCPELLRHRLPLEIVRRTGTTVGPAAGRDEFDWTHPLRDIRT
jgi:Transposase IS116/IS110/IS902 family